MKNLILYPWVSVVDKPLFILDKNSNWICTKEAENEFIAAVPLVRGRWWIKHCTILDEVGLCVVTDGDYEPAGYEMNDVAYYFPMPTTVDIAELKARTVLEGIEKVIGGGKMFRKYTQLDLIKFARFKEEHPNMKPHEAVKAYSTVNPEKTAIEKLNNLSNGLNFPDLLKN